MFQSIKKVLWGIGYGLAAIIGFLTYSIIYLISTIIPLALAILFVGWLLGWFSSDHSVKNSASDKSYLPEQFIDDRINFTKSLECFAAASKLLQPPNDSDISFEIPKEKWETVILLIQDGITVSKKVDDNFFDYLHPRLNFFYREKLIQGQKLYLESIKESKKGDYDFDISRQLEAIKAISLISEWDAYCKSNREAIFARAFQGG